MLEGLRSVLCKAILQNEEHFFKSYQIKSLQSVVVQGRCGAVTDVVLRMMSLEEKGIFKLHSLEVHGAEAQSPEVSVGESSQIEAVRQVLRNAGSAGQLSSVPPNFPLMASLIVMATNILGRLNDHKVLSNSVFKFSSGLMLFCPHALL